MLWLWPEPVDGFNYHFGITLAHCRVARQAQLLGGKSLGYRHLKAVELSVALLFVARNRIVYKCLYPLRGKVCLQCFALLAEYGEYVVDVCSRVGGWLCSYVAVANAFEVKLCNLFAVAVVGIEAG